MHQEVKFEGQYTSSVDTDFQLTKVHEADAGLDILSAQALVLPAGKSEVVKTGLHVAIPFGFVGLIWPRSGLSVKHRIETGAGCIDSGYRGELLVHLYNFGETDYMVNVGQKIAQLLTIPVHLGLYTKVDTLDETPRGYGGFGHTGDFVQ